MTCPSSPFWRKFVFTRAGPSRSRGGINPLHRSGVRQAAWGLGSLMCDFSPTGAQQQLSSLLRPAKERREKASLPLGMQPALPGKKGAAGGGARGPAARTPWFLGFWGPWPMQGPYLHSLRFLACILLPRTSLHPGKVRRRKRILPGWASLPLFHPFQILLHCSLPFPRGQASGVPPRPCHLG